MYLYTSQPPRDSKALRPESPRDDFLGGPFLDPRSTVDELIDQIDPINLSSAI